MGEWAEQEVDRYVGASDVIRNPRAPSRVTSWRVCPACGSRASKMFNLNSGKYRCQICGHEYDPPAKKERA